MQNITIAVSEAGSAQTRTFDYKVTLDGEVVSERRLSPVQTSQVREMAMQYLSLLQGGSSSPGAKSYLPILGAGLFHLFLESGWQEFGSKILAGEVGRLIINSSIPEVLQLPWELLRLPGREDILGDSPDKSLIRHPDRAESLSSFSLELAPGPLRVLFLAAERDFEREESEMLKMAEGLDLLLEISDSGTLEELKSLAESFRPHIVHLVGQARMSGVQAGFSMPDTDSGGRSDLCSADELAEALKNSGAGCIILGGRQSEPAFAQGLLCQMLAEHIPMSVAWNGSTASASSFYRSLVKGDSLDTALKAAVVETRKTGREAGAIAAFPVLYTTCDESCDQSRDRLRLFDPQRNESVAATVCKEQPPLISLTEGYAECFVDRRRDLERFLPLLLGGTVHTLIITGPNGVGKSTLAVRLARLLALSGYSILPIYASSNNPISSPRLLDAIIGQTTAGTGGDLMRLKDPSLSVEERLKISIDFLKANRILMLWDGLDLDSKTGKIADPELADFYRLLLKDLVSARAIITCSSLPAEALILPSQSRELKIPGLSETAFIRVLLRDELVANRYRKGELSYADLQVMHSSFLGNPANLAQMRRALRTELSPGDDARARLYATLGPESHQALSRAAVYEIAMSPAGFAAVAEVPVETALATLSLWQSLSLVYEVGELWVVPSSDRAAYLVAISLEERGIAQKLAGDFLRDQAESGRSAELSLSRLDCLLEARGHYLAASDLEDARVITGRISGYLEKRGYYSEIIRLNRELLDLQPDAEPLGWIARVYADQGDYGRSQEWYERAIKIAPVASAYLGLGTAYLSLGKLEPAGVNLQKAVDIYVSEGDRAGVAAGLLGLASIDMEKNENEAAHLKLQQIAEISESLGDLFGRARALQEMARLDMIRRDYETAQPKLLESLQLMQRLGDRTGEDVVLFNLASLFLEKGDFALANQEFQKALMLARENGDRIGEAAILHSLGLINSNAGDRDLARENFEEALRIFQEIADRSGEAGAFFQLGAIALQQDKIQEGLRLMALAAIILRSIKSDEVKNVEPLVERLASQLGNTQEQFMIMVQEVLQSYVRDRGWGLVERASGK
jgi:tetratricopeptide (TPR) repeat protein